MKTKKVFYTEIAYLVGIVALALGTALMEKADFGVSMVVAPAYILHLKLSQYFSWYSFGVSEYCLQAVVLVILSLVMGKAKKSYLCSFVTAVFYGTILDFCMALCATLPVDGYAYRSVWYVLGMVVCSLGIAFLFRTYVTPEAYELFVKEVAEKSRVNIGKVKTIYDVSSCILAVLLSFVFFGFGHFEGVKLGTVFCAFTNGAIIVYVGKVLERFFVFKDGLKYRAFFEN